MLCSLTSVFLPQALHPMMSELTTPSSIQHHTSSTKQQQTNTRPTDLNIHLSRPKPHNTHNNGLPHALCAPQRRFRPSCHQLHPDRRPSRLPDLATEDGRCRCAGAQACWRLQGNVSLSELQYCQNEHAGMLGIVRGGRVREPDGSGWRHWIGEHAQCKCETGKSCTNVVMTRTCD